MPRLGKSEIEKRLKRHLASLEAGENVSKRDMRAVLTEEQMEDYEAEWENHRDYKQWILDSGSVLSDYHEIVRTADAYHIRAEKTRTGPKANRNYRKAEFHYERAFERLDELSSIYPWLSALFDRTLDQDSSWETGPSYHGIPRYMFSQSHACNRRRRESLPTKRDVKIRAIRFALENLYTEPADEESELAEQERHKAVIERGKRLRERLRRS